MKLTEKKTETPITAVELADPAPEYLGAMDASREFSVLNLYRQDFAAKEIENEAFYLDLNLFPVIDKMTMPWGKAVRKLYMFLPKTPEETAFRRGVNADVNKEPIYRALLTLMERLGHVREMRKEKEKTSNRLQRAVWKLREAGAYCSAYEELAEALSGVELESEGMRKFSERLTEILTDGGFRQMKKETEELLSEIHGIRFVVTYEKDRVSVEPVDGQTAAEGEASYEEWLARFDGGAGAGMPNPFVTDPTLTELEAACLEMLKSKKPEFFRALQAAADHETEYERPVLARFEREIPFYLAFRGFRMEMERAGFAFATPTADEGKPMEARGLYDVALALMSYPEGRPVISNDFYYGDGERFFVLTGPNQGGKTTFARSLGQLVFFAMMGLDVPAKSANVPFFAGIQTHFSVEESVETGRGKLMEELVRLQPMMEDWRKGSFVVINELFTTAANYDAQIMGKRVLAHFLSLGCKGIYVTHLTELADESEGIVSLRAMLDEHGVQTFEIRRGSAEDTACAANQVNKYRLTYEQLKERL